MPDEEKHLRQADRHIADSERRITRQEQRVATAKASGGDSRESERLLANFKANLAEMYFHRRMIVDKIAEQEKPSPPKQ